MSEKDMQEELKDRCWFPRQFAGVLMLHSYPYSLATYWYLSYGGLRYNTARAWVEDHRYMWE